MTTTTTTKVPEFKIILCGDYGVGKTSIFRRFLNDTFIDTSKLSRTQSRQSTLGLDQYSRDFEVHSGSDDGFRKIRIQLWDTGGLERIASITNSYYKFSDAALLVFDVSSSETFHSISNHLLEVLSMAEQAKIFLIANKSDLIKQRQVSDDDIDLFVEQFPKINGFFQISAKTNDGLKEMWSDISEKLAATANSMNVGAFKLHQLEDMNNFNGDSYVGTSNSSNCCS